MRSGYAALFGAVLAYSAWQGISALPAGNNSRQRAANSSGGDADSGRSKPAASVGGFPTIASGISEVSFVAGQEPCPNHKALCPASDLLGLIADYFEPELKKKNEADDTRHWNVPASERTQIEFVIASLPDPVHTHMALMFDREIETIEGAAQRSGYLFARSWMPWDISTHNESTDFTVRMAQQQFREQVEKLPGLMIFRRSGIESVAGAAKSILFVFVTGERPTGGLQAEQFENALKIRDLISPGVKDRANILRVLGPSFSGSLFSLHSILKSETWRNHFSRVLIRSGTVSSDRAVRDFSELNATEWPQDPKKLPDPQGRPDFATFQLSDTYGEVFLNDFLNCQKRVHSHSQVAILSEDETAFGNQEERPKQEPPQDKSATAPDGCPAKLPPAEIFVRLYFPRGIAQLRDAYERELKSQPSPVGSAAPPQAGLPLSLTTTGNDDDSVPPFSLQTPLSEESVMQGIVATLRKQHVRLILIRASDPLDVIFLVHFLRQNYPQGRLITVGADLLTIHDFYDPRFHGILALTSYPLFEGADFPSYAEGNPAPPPVHRLFPDSFQPGTYNAFLSLLAPAAESNVDKLPAAPYEQFGLPSFLQNEAAFSKSGVWRAHLWLTAAGKDGFWPVDVLDEESNSANPATAAGVPTPPPSVRAAGLTPSAPTQFVVHFSVGWTLFWMIPFVLTIAIALLLAFPPSPFTSSETLSRFAHVSNGLPASQVFSSCNRLLFFACILLLAMQTVFVFPSEIWLFSFGWLHKHDLHELIGDALDGLPLVEGFYLLSVGFLAFATARGFRKRGSTRLAWAGAAVCLLAILLNLEGVFHWRTADISIRFGSFLFRYINLGSGVSPSLPLFFLVAGWLWWCWHSLTGITSAKEKQMDLPDEADFNESTVPDALARYRLRKISAKKGEWPWRVLKAVPWGADKPKCAWSSIGIKILAGAVAGFVMICLLMSPREIAESFEGWQYKILDWALLYSCLFLVCYLLAHIIALWLEFRNLTRAIERVPFRRGFGDLKNLTWKPLWKLAGSGRQEFVKLLGAEMDGLSQIQNSSASALSAGLLKAINEAQKAVNRVVATMEHSEHGTPAQDPLTAPQSAAADVHELFHDLQFKLAKVTAEGLIFATQNWKRESYSPPVTSSGDNKAVEPPAADPTMRAIEHFLCLFYVNVIMIPLRRLQTLILAMAGVFVFVLLSYSSYPFESRESFHVLLISVFFALSLVVGIVYGQMYTDPLLSRITNTKPGELGLDFWVKLGTFVFVPLLSLISVQFPEVNNFLFSWLQPALQSVK
ncbi:MAG: hypothetical protein WB729_16235 [Candidatus Sulfotelmatobacter sp.]